MYIPRYVKEKNSSIVIKVPEGVGEASKTFFPPKILKFRAFQMSRAQTPGRKLLIPNSGYILIHAGKSYIAMKNQTG